MSYVSIREFTCTVRYTVYETIVINNMDYKREMEKVEKNMI